MQEEKMTGSDIKPSSRTRSARVWKVRVEAVGIEVLWGCGGWLLGQAQMLFGTYPLGLSLLCASHGHTLSVLIGLIITTMTNVKEPIVYICTYLAAACIRLFAGMVLDNPDGRVTLPERLRRKLRGEKAIRENEPSIGFFQSVRAAFSESVCLRMATGAVSSLIIGVYRVIRGGFEYYDLFAALFGVIFVPAAVLIFSVALEGRISHPVLKNSSYAALLYSFVFAATTVVMLTFPLSPMAALFFTLYVSCKEGIVKGCATGLLCGVAYDPMHAPAYLLASLVYLFLRRPDRESGAVLGASGVMVAWSVYIEGPASLLVYIPAALLSGMSFTVFQKLFLSNASESEEAKTPTEVPEGHMEHHRYKDANERFRGISDAFSSLSEVFYNLSDRFRRPGTLDLRRLCDDSFDAFCNTCPNKSVCWGLEYSETLGTVNELIACLHTKGRVSRDQVGKQLARRCVSMESILEQINRECSRMTGEMLRNNRTEIFAMDYEAAANIINDALEEDDGEYRFDPELERRISEYLGDAGVKMSGVTVYGNRRRRILVKGVDIDHAKVTFETLRSDLGEMCGSELGQPVFEVENSISTMVLQAKQKFAVTGAQNNVSADGGVSGDSINLFSNKKDYFYALISDGMGAGREAALTSNLCSVFLEKMLRAGNRAGTSLKMLNNMIRSRGADSSKECSSTIDLLELDMMTGNASFIKSGAAPSFIVRGNVVRRLQAGTVPIGIICTLDAQQTDFTLMAGDIVVMISDGILQDDAECEWLSAYLATVYEQTPEEIVSCICRHAAKGEGHDDCSAVALRIHRAED